MSKTQFLTLEDRFRMLPPGPNPFTVESIAEELGKTPEQAKRMVKSYIGQSEKALQNIEGNHVKDADLNKAMNDASMAMIKWLESDKKIARLDAYGLASVAMDCRVGAISAMEKNIHCLMPKSIWQASR